MAKRGAAENPKSRFERIGVAPEPGEAAALAEGVGHLETRLLDDPSRSILATNQSPDVGFDVSINPYRGCTHGCVYCYARPTHEYLGFSAGLDFETRILVKRRAPALLRKALDAPRWTPQVIALSGVTDAYQPAERKLEITRGCLQVLADFRNPVAVVTKSRLVTRDRDLLGELAGFGAAAVNLSITSLDPQLQQRMEPRASAPQQRLAAIRELARAGVPVGVMVAPIIPGLNDHEVPRILQAAADAGAGHAAHIVLRLPHGLVDLFGAWLERHYPERKGKVLNRVREVRGGRFNDPRFGSRMRGQGLYAEQVRALFHSAARRVGLDGPPPALSTAAFRRPGGEQLGLFR
jgi:DNA repair photolyase